MRFWLKLYSLRIRSKANGYRLWLGCRLLVLVSGWIIPPGYRAYIAAGIRAGLIASAHWQRENGSPERQEVEAMIRELKQPSA